MRNVVAQTFSKGINVRLPIDRFDGDPTKSMDQRLFTLQNARLTSRGGDTYYIRRIEGSEPVGEGFYPFTLDVQIYKKYIIVLYKQDRDSFYHYIDIVHVDDPLTPVIDQPFVYGGVNTRDVGKLILLEDTILIAPHNKQLNFIDETWFFNDFVSTTPLLDIIPAVPGDDPENDQVGKYKSMIRVVSGVTNATTPGQKATISLRMTGLPIFEGNQFTFTIGQVLFDGVSLGPFTFEPGDFGETYLVLEFLREQFLNNTTLANKWDFELVEGSTIDSEDLKITSKTTGIVNNGKDLQLGGITADGIDNQKALIANNLWQMGAFGSFTPTKIGSTVGGTDANQYGGLVFEFGNIIATTRVFSAGETPTQVAAAIRDALVISLATNYNITIENDADVIIQAKKIGAVYNFNTISVTNPSTGIVLTITPIALGANVSGGDFLTNDTLWYIGRNVYRDGHKTKTTFPVQGEITQEADKVQLVIKPTQDLDGTYCAVEIFRKTGSSPFYFIKKVKPQTTDQNAEGFLRGGVPSIKFLYTDPEGFPASSDSVFVFKLGDFVTPEVELNEGDDEETWLQKIYNAFFGIDGFTALWNISLLEETGPIIFEAKVGSSEFNSLNIEVQGDDVRTLTPTTIISTFTTNPFSNVQVLNLETPTQVKLYTNDTLRFDAGGGNYVFVSVAQNVPIGSSVIPIVETVSTPPVANIRFIRGEAYSDFGYITQDEGEDPYMYLTDDGLVDIYELDEKDYVWSQNHYTHEIVRDRYVRANLFFESKDLGLQEGMFRVNESVATIGEEDTTPFYSNSIVYAQGRYKDGTTSFFEELGRFDTTTESERLTLAQDFISNPDIKEYAFYAKYTPKRRPFVEAAGLGFYNINLPTQLTSKYKRDDSNELSYLRQPFGPVNPRLFIGFSHIRRTFGETGVGFTQAYNYFPTDAYEFAINEDTPTSFLLASIPTTDTTMTTPNTIDFEYGGVKTKYILQSVDSSSASAVYVSAVYLGLKNLLDRVPLFYEFDTFSAAQNQPFTGVSNKLIEGLRVPVVGYELVSNPETVGEKTGALFINLQSGTVLDSVSAQITKKIPLTGNLLTAEYASDKHAFMANIENPTEGPSITGKIVGMAFEGSDIFGIDEKVDSLVYLGRKDNEITITPQKLLTGYTTDSVVETFTNINVTIFFSKLKDSNIYGTLQLETDIPYIKEQYPNQIMWSEPFVLNSFANGHRNFLSTSFLNLPADYGKIVGIEYINNRLLVFTEHGVAMVNVGEVLTQQVGGEVFVDATGFLNGYSWALKELPQIMPRSIVQYENMVFFCDGIDVWKYDGEFSNISAGAIPLTGQGFGIGIIGQPGDPTTGPKPGGGTGTNPGGGGPGGGGTSQPGTGLFMGSNDIYWGQDNRYMGEDGTGTTTTGGGGDDDGPGGGDDDDDDFDPTDPNEGSGVGTVGIGAWVGALDPYNKEYRLTDNITTYAFSIEFSEWFGPYTYRDRGSDFFKNQMYSVVDRRLVRQNVGSTFNGFEYDTIVESVGNVMTRPDMVKIWRKFYLDAVINYKQPSQYNPGTGGPGGGGVGAWWGSDDFYMGEPQVYMGDNSDSSGVGGPNVVPDEDADVPDGAPNVLGINKVFFSYRKETYLPYRTFDLGFAKIKNNRYNIGIVNAHQNSEQLYWKIKTKEPHFVLKMVAFEYVNRDRR